MNRNEVLELIRSHLAEELEIEPSRIQDDTRFKEDLEADSLDLVALIQELEDRYGVRITDEDAAKLTTVGQSADYVAERLEQSEAQA
jgi:acyl carrier protein